MADRAAQEEAAQEEAELQQEQEGDDYKDAHQDEGASSDVPAERPKLPFNCSAGFQNWESGWSYPKKEWCCKHNSRGCERFDCSASSATWEASWSKAQKSWCCNYENKACKSAGYTTVAVVTNDFAATDDEAHDKVKLKRGEVVWAHSKTLSGWTYLSTELREMGWAPHSFLSASRPVVCVQDHLDATGDKYQPQLSVRVGDTLWVIKEQSGWTYAYTLGLRGWVPDSVLLVGPEKNASAVHVAWAGQDFKTSGREEDKQIAVAEGEMVLIVNSPKGNMMWAVNQAKQEGWVSNLVLRSTQAVLAVKNFEPGAAGGEFQPQLAVLRGDTVWVTKVTKSEWTYGYSHGQDGWVPLWALRQPDFGGEAATRAGASFLEVPFLSWVLCAALGLLASSVFG